MEKRNIIISQYDKIKNKKEILLLVSSFLFDLSTRKVNKEVKNIKDIPEKINNSSSLLINKLKDKINIEISGNA